MVPMTGTLPILPNWRGLTCLPYADFTTIVGDAGGKLTSTVETPTFPTLKRLMVVTYGPTKEIFGARDDCVMVPAIFADHPDTGSGGSAPIIMFAQPGPPPPKMDGL